MTTKFIARQRVSDSFSDFISESNPHHESAAAVTSNRLVCDKCHKYADRSDVLRLSTLFSGISKDFPFHRRLQSSLKLPRRLFLLNFLFILRVNMPHSTTAPSTYWPPWPIFSAEKGENKPENVTYKRTIVGKYGAEAIRQSWLEICKILERVTAEIAAKNTEIIPVLTLEELLNASEETKEQLKNIGCFVVRGVLPRNEATQWYWDLKGYAEENRESITGMPN
jgi:hypothetical protein